MCILTEFIQSLYRDKSKRTKISIRIFIGGHYMNNTPISDEEERGAIGMCFTA